VLQCVAVCCSVSQCVAVCVVVCCSAMQYFFGECSPEGKDIAVSVAAYCSMLQYVAVCCSELQCVAVSCSALQRVAMCLLKMFT